MKKKIAQADLESLYRVFTVPEAPDSTVGKIDQAIYRNLVGFLQEHIVAVEKDLNEIEQDFSNFRIENDPQFVSEQVQFLLEKCVAHSVHTAAPSFVGHMTSALPYFMLPLSRMMVALNQNMVKIETSKAFTPLERQVLGMLHSLVFNASADFYQRWMHHPEKSIGVICSGGTVANITALWVARNRLLKAKDGFLGVHQEGLHQALQFYGYTGAVVLVSERGHYSLSKAIDLLGIGRCNLIAIETDVHHRIRLDLLREKIQQLKVEKKAILAIVGVAGSSETGSVDPLEALAEIAEKEGCHFHIDAAWGGPTLFSEKYQHLLRGINRADSVTIDAHKQLYVPMGAGAVVFREPEMMDSIEHHAEYIIRKGSRDIGSHSLEGSRPGMALLIHSGLRIIGRKGYALLIDLGIDKARAFAAMLEKEADFELISAPQLNILTYRFVPEAVRQALSVATPEKQEQINQALNELTRVMQKTQRRHGKSFVSRTLLRPTQYHRQAVVVFRVVLSNPLTTLEILQNMLVEQRALIKEPHVAKVLEEVFGCVC
jgi:glutamate decarboxylase